MIILKEKPQRNIDGRIRKVLDRIDYMGKTGRLDGLSLADFRVLQFVMKQWTAGENPEFIQANVADWLGRNGILVRSKGAGFIISEKVLYREGLLNFKETNNLPVIAKIGGISTNPKITSVVRQDTIFGTLQAMGLDPYINKMNNVVVSVSDLPTMTAVMSTIFQQFGVKGSMVIPWDGTHGKIYYDPKEPVNQAQALAYSKTAGLPPPNPRKYLA